jgi:pyruvate/2-oxoglutarate dehydrogenase complex dihydrolipoamide acyltransferase (E2) component
VSERKKIRGWRKIAAATWGPPNDPQIYGDLDIDATNLLAFIEEAREVSGEKVTVTHVAGKAVAHALGQHPDLNVRMYRGHFVQRPTVDIFFIVSADAGSELSGVKVVEADRKSVVEIAAELGGRARTIRSGDDPEFGKTKSMLARPPIRALGYMLRLAAWITSDRDMDLPKRGLPRQPFGSAMITSVGMFGIQRGYAPLSPYYRIPFLVLVGEVTPKPVVLDDEIVARPILTITATMDHRYVDGFHASRLARSVREYLEDPKRHEPALG